MFKSMLRNALLALSAVLCTVSVSGCGETREQLDANPSSGVRFSTAEEIELGKRVKAQVYKEYKVWNNDTQRKRVRGIFSKIVAVSKDDRDDLIYEIELLDTKEVNAFAAPGGFMWVTRGFLETVSDDNQLACVLGHELAHVTYRHSLRQIQSDMTTSAIIGIIAHLATGGESSDTANLVAGLSFQILSSHYSREHESQADRMGMKYAWRAGYDPNGIIHFFEKMEKESKGGNVEFLSSHPSHSTRIQEAREEIQKKGYIRK